MIKKLFIILGLLLTIRVCYSEQSSSAYSFSVSLTGGVDLVSDQTVQGNKTFNGQVVLSSCPTANIANGVITSLSGTTVTISSGTIGTFNASSINASSITAYSLQVATITGFSPVFINADLKLQDGSIMTSTGNFTSATHTHNGSDSYALASNSVGSSQLSTGAVGEDEIGTGAVTVNKIGAGAVTGVKLASVVVGDTLVNSNNTIKTGGSGASYVLTKETVTPRSGALRIKFTITRAINQYYGQIWRNGSPVGTERMVSGGSGDVEYSEDISGWTAGDLVQLYTHGSYSGATSYKNFMIYAIDSFLWRNSLE